MTTMFSKKMLYIPDYVVYQDIPTIIKYFEDFNIAKIKNVQVFKHLEPEYYVEDKYNYCYALIEVEFYYNNQGSQNFYNAIENNKCVMVYDDPLYWEVQFSPFKEHAMPLVSDCNSSTNSNTICDSTTHNHNVNDVCDTSEEEDYYYSSEEDDPKDPDYEDEEEDEESDDDYNYETYKKNYANFKSKQKAKKQKLLNELSEIQKTIELIKNKQEKMRKLLIQNKKSKSKTNEYKTNWSRRLRVSI